MYLSLKKKIIVRQQIEVMGTQIKTPLYLKTKQNTKLGENKHH